MVTGRDHPLGRTLRRAQRPVVRAPRREVLAEHDGTTGNLLVDYISAEGQFVAKVLADGTTSYSLRDRLSERLKLDSQGNVLGQQGDLPYGEDFGETGGQERVIVAV